MAGKTIQLFLQEVFTLANQRCGNTFEKETTALLIERERLLSNSWKKITPADIVPDEMHEILREIDFDTIISNTTRYLKQKDYLVFLYDVAEISIGFSELDKAERLLRLLVEKHVRSTGKKLRAKAHQKLGNVAFYRNNFRAAEQEYKKSLTQYSALDDKTGIAGIKNALGVLLVVQGSPSKGVAFFKTARDLLKNKNSNKLLTKINMNVGNAYTMRGQWDLAMMFYNEALGTLGANGNYNTRALIILDISIIYLAKGQLSEAMENIHNSIRYAKRANNPHTKALSYLGEAEIHCKQGDYPTATALATTAFRVFSEVGDQLSKADVYKLFGMISRDSNKLNVALSFFENSKQMNKNFNNPLNLGETLLEMGELYRNLGNNQKASENIKSAIKCFKQIEAETRVLQAQQTLTSIPTA